MPVSVPEKVSVRRWTLIPPSDSENAIIYDESHIYFNGVSFTDDYLIVFTEMTDLVTKYEYPKSQWRCIMKETIYFSPYEKLKDPEDYRVCGNGDGYRRYRKGLCYFCYEQEKFPYES